MVSDFALRSVSAWALPRPSAIASAKLANNTVNQSHNVICRLKPNPLLCASASRTSVTVVSTLRISTTNITGLRAILRGSSLMSASISACRTIFPSHSDFAFYLLILVSPSVVHLQVFKHRPQTQRRKERKRTYNHNHAHQQYAEQRRRHRERSLGWR